METAHPRPLQTLLPPIIATIGWLVLAMHQSTPADLFGRYSLAYAALLGLWAVNAGLLWRRSLQEMTATSAFRAPPGIWRELLLMGSTVAALVFAEHLFGTRAFVPSDGVALVLIAAILLQIIPRSGPDPRRLLTSPSTLLLIIVLTGALVRIYAIDFGLPTLYDPDEYWFVAIAREMIVDQNPNPRWFGHPGSTSIYLLAAIYGGLHWMVGALGPTPGSLYAFINQHQAEIYLAGRLVSAAFGVATIGMTYAVASRLFQPAIGLAAAAFMALSPLHVTYSRLIRSDVQATFLVLVAFWFALDIVERGRWRSVLLAGLITGTATATKYPAALIGSTAALGVLLAPGSPRRRLQMLGFYLAAAVAGVLMSSPYLLLDMKTALADLSAEAPDWVLSHAGEGFLRNLVWYLSNPLAMAVSAGGVGLAVAGFALCIIDRTKSRWLLMSFPAVFMVFVATLPIRLRHWILPLVPFLCVLAGLGLVETVRLIRRRASLQGSLWPVFLVLAVTLPIAKTDLIRGRELMLPDTRILAGEWILTHIPPGRSLVVEAWTPQLPIDRYQFLVVDRTGHLIDAVAEQRDKSEADMRPFERSAHDAFFIPYGQLGKIKDLSAIDRSGGDYMVMTDKVYKSYIAERAACEPCEQVIRTYDALMASATIIYELEPVEGELRGPKVSIFQLERVD